MSKKVWFMYWRIISLEDIFSNLWVCIDRSGNSTILFHQDFSDKIEFERAINYFINWFGE